VDCGAVDDFTRQGRSRCAACNASHYRPDRKTMTQEQRDRENADKREWAKMRKAAHLCVHCGAQDKRTLKGMSSCLKCAKSRSKKQRETWDYQHEKELRDARRQRNIDAGLCTVCGGKKEDPKMAMCCTCRVKAKLRNAKRKIEHGWLPRGANGKCYQCNRAPAIKGKKLCQECYDKKIITLRANSAKRSQKTKEE